MQALLGQLTSRLPNCHPDGTRSQSNEKEQDSEKEYSNQFESNDVAVKREKKTDFESACDYGSCCTGRQRSGFGFALTEVLRRSQVVVERNTTRK